MAISRPVFGRFQHDPKLMLAVLVLVAHLTHTSVSELADAASLCRYLLEDDDPRAAA